MSTSPRKPEIIVTRKKSFEMKRQLRDTAKSMKRISQMTKILRAPINENNPELYNETKKEKKMIKKIKTKKSKKEHEKKESPKKIKVKTYANKNKFVHGESSIVIKKEILERVRLSDDEDLPPEKPKRGRRKKIIAINQVTGNTATNMAGCKRKMVDIEKDIPKASKQLKMSSVTPVEPKDQVSRPLSPPQSGELPSGSPYTEDLMVDTDSLTGEDLLEILTCESPVWWEDLPRGYYGYGEQISSKTPRGEFKKINTQTPEPKTLHVNENLIFDDKFLKKRSKLENLLGNIKNKLDKTCNYNESKSKISINDNNHVEIKKTNQMKDDKAKADETKLKEDDTKIKENDTKIKEDDTKINENINKLETTKKTKTISGSSENDEFLYNHDLLDDFANIEIPMDDDVLIVEDENNQNIIIDNCEANDNNNYDASVKNNDSIVENQKRNDKNRESNYNNQDLEDRSVYIKRIDTPAFVVDLKNEQNLPKIKNTTLVSSFSSKIKNNTEARSPAIPKMTISSIEKESSSPISIKSSAVSDVTSISSVDDLGTISDTNITFIDEIGDRNSINDERNSTNEERNFTLRDKVETTQKEIISGSSKEINTKTDSSKTFSRLKEAYKVLCNKQIKSLGSKKISSILNKSELNNENKVDHVTRQLKINDNLTETHENYVEKHNNKINIQENVKNCDIDEVKINIKDDQIKKNSYDEIIIQKTSDFDQNNINIETNNERTKINSFYKKCKNSTKRRIKTLPTRVILEEDNIGSEIMKTKLNISILNNRKLKNIKPTTKSTNIDQIKTNIGQNTSNEKTTIISQNKSNAKATNIDQITTNIGQNTSNEKTTQNTPNAQTTKVNQITSNAKNTNIAHNTSNAIITKVYQNTSKAKTTKIDQTNTNIGQNTSNEKNTKIDQYTSKNIEKSDSKLVSNTAVKYCMKCSSIFDTEDCGYCLRKTVKL